MEAPTTHEALGAGRRKPFSSSESKDDEEGKPLAKRPKIADEEEEEDEEAEKAKIANESGNKEEEEEEATASSTSTGTATTEAKSSEPTLDVDGILQFLTTVDLYDTSSERQLLEVLKEVAQHTAHSSERYDTNIKLLVGGGILSALWKLVVQKHIKIATYALTTLRNIVETARSNNKRIDMLIQSMPDSHDAVVWHPLFMSFTNVLATGLDTKSELWKLSKAQLKMLMQIADVFTTGTFEQAETIMAKQGLTRLFADFIAAADLESQDDRLATFQNVAGFVLKLSQHYPSLLSQEIHKGIIDIGYVTSLCFRSKKLKHLLAGLEAVHFFCNYEDPSGSIAFLSDLAAYADNSEEDDGDYYLVITNTIKKILKDEATWKDKCPDVLRLAREIHGLVQRNKTAWA